MFENLLLSTEALKQLGCRKVTQQDGVLTIKLPDRRGIKNSGPDIEVSSKLIKPVIFSIEQIHQFHKLPFELNFDLLPPESPELQGLSGMLIRYRFNNELEDLWDGKNPSGWIKRDDEFQRTESLHRGMQPNILFHSILPNWLHIVAYEPLVTDNSFIIGTIRDQITGKKFRVTTGMRNEIFMSNHQIFDQNTISTYFSSKYPQMEIQGV